MNAKRYLNYLVALLFVVILTTTARADNILYCLSELGTGILKENNQWITRGIIPQRFAIKFADDYSSVDGVLESEGTLTCFSIHREAFDIPETIHSIRCVDLYTIFDFNKRNRRFVVFNRGLYVENLPKKFEDYGVGDSISAGTCEKF